MPNTKIVLKKGWYLIDADAPHNLEKDANGDVLRFEDFDSASAYAKANFQPHDVLFLFVDHDNFAWGE